VFAVNFIISRHHCNCERANSRPILYFHTAVKEVYGPQSMGTFPLLSSDGSTLITDKPQILQRWAEHFHNVLNRPSSITDTVLAQLPQIEVNPLLADPPSLLAVNKAIEQMKSGKAPGADSIPSEVFKVRRSAAYHQAM